MIASSIRPPLDKVRSVGFPKSTNTLGDASSNRTTALPTTIAKSAPLKKQAKGRWFINCIIFSFLGFVFYSLWTELGRFQAFGKIEGTVIHIAPIAAGRISTVEINEGDFVQAGQLLAVVDARELKIDLRKIRSELQIALSNLNVRMAEVRERSVDRAAEQIDRRTEYFKMLSEFHDKQSKLEEFQKAFEIQQSLRASNTVSELEYRSSKSAYDGIRLQIDDLKSAIATLEPIANRPPRDIADEFLESEQSRVLEIRSELVELESLLEASRIMAPVAGRVLKRNCNPGEYVDPNRTIVELVQADSVEGAIYLPQQLARLLKIGDTISLFVVPLGRDQIFRVERVSPELAAPPTALQSKYRAFKDLVRVHAVPVDTSKKPGKFARNAIDFSTCIGAELALPRFFYRVPQAAPCDPQLSLRSSNGGAGKCD